MLSSLAGVEPEVVQIRRSRGQNLRQPSLGRHHQVVECLPGTSIGYERDAQGVQVSAQPFVAHSGRAVIRFYCICVAHMRTRDTATRRRHYVQDRRNRVPRGLPRLVAPRNLVLRQGIYDATRLCAGSRTNLGPSSITKSATIRTHVDG